MYILNKNKNIDHACNKLILMIIIIIYVKINTIILNLKRVGLLIMVKHHFLSQIKLYGSPFL